MSEGGQKDYMFFSNAADDTGKIIVTLADDIC
jgi:hypothetical protein